MSHNDVWNYSSQTVAEMVALNVALGSLDAIKTAVELRSSARASRLLTFAGTLIEKETVPASVLNEK